MIPVEYYFVLSALLFFIGVFGFVTRRNLLAMLISVELVLNAVDINFAAINRLLYPQGMEGMFMTLFVIGVAMMVALGFTSLSSSSSQPISFLPFDCTKASTRLVK